jgi:carbon monoxide dehydrogenase subunit G
MYEAKLRVSNIIEIQASLTKVFYWLDDPNRAKKWMTSVTKFEIIKETTNRVGTTFHEYIEENGRGIEMNGVVTEFVSNERFAVHLESNINSVDVSFVLEQKGGITQLTQNAELHFKGMLKVLSILLRASIRKKIIRQTQGELARLKELCEQDS